MNPRTGLLALAALGLAGCGLGTAGAVGASGGGGNSNAAASLLAFRVEGTKESPAELRFVLQDAEADAVSIEFLFALQAQGLVRMTQLAGVASNPATLATSAAGIDYTIAWDFAAEPLLPADGSFVDGITVFASLAGSRDLVPGANALELGMGNDPPALDSVNVPVGPSGEVSGIVLVELVVSDTSDDVVSIAAEYNADAPDFPGAAWQSASPAGQGLDDVVADRGGTARDFFWDTEADLGGSSDGEVLLRFTANDAAVEGEPRASNTFRVDNNAEPIAFIQSDLFLSNPDQVRGIPVPYQVFDEEGDPVRVVFQWRRPDEDFPELPADRAGVEELLADPARRRAAQVCTEYPNAFVGRVVPLDPTTVRLPELAGPAAHVLAGDPQSLVGRQLEILRPSVFPEPLDAPAKGWDLSHPVAALPVGDGLTALVLDRPVPGAWRLRELALATGAVVRTVVASAPGEPSAMAFEPDGRSVLVASDVVGDWRVERVRLEDGARRSVVEPGPSVDRGPVRAIAPLGTGAALVTVGSSLVFLDYVHLGLPGVVHTAPQAHGPERSRTRPPYVTPLGSGRAIPLLTALASPWGVVRDPLRTNGVYLAERDADRVLALQLDSRARVPVVVRSEPLDPSISQPRSLALGRGGSRLLIVTGAQSTEIRGVDLGGAEDNRLFTLSELPTGVYALSGGPDGLLLAPLPEQDDLAVGGGLEQVERITAYDASRRVASVGRPFVPELRPGSRWRVVETLAASDPAGESTTFVWNTKDVAHGRILLRATPIDDEPGLSSETLASKQVLWRRKVDELGSPALTRRPQSGVAADIDGDGDLDILSANVFSNTLTVFFQQDPGVFDTTPLVLGGPALTDSPRFVAAADVDGNGRLDVLSANGTSHTLTVFFQQRTGVFDPTPLVFGDPSTTNTPLCVAAADIDGNGRLDILSANAVSDTLTVFFQQSSGVFDTEPLVLGNSAQTDSPRFLSAADIDGDGLLDIFSANAASDTMTVFFQQRQGVFDATPLELGGPALVDGPASVAAADIDGDGDLDILSANTFSDTLTVFFQQSPGVFDTAPLELGGSVLIAAPASAAAADIDGDGDLDILSANLFSDTLTVFYQQNPGDLDTTPLELGHLVFTDLPFFLAAADIDGDGDLDVLSTNVFNDTLVVFLQQSPGVFDTTPLELGGPALTDGPASVLAADIDGDGDLDILSANGTSDTLTVFLQLSPGVFDTTPLELGGPALIDGPVFVVAADIDGDGDLDILSANATSDTLTVFFQLSPGLFDTTPLELGGPALIDGPVSVAAADIDGDGDLDILSANGTSDTLTVFFQLSPGVFDTTPLELGGPAVIDGPRSVAAADLDGDGNLDILSANLDSDTLTVFFQQSPGIFNTTPLEFGGPALTDGASSVAAADLDGDGDLDIVSANSVSDTLTVFFQQSSGAFYTTPLVLGSSALTDSPQSVVAADVDGDGDMDILSANALSDTLTVFWGGR